MEVLIVSATPFEIAPLQEFLEQHFVPFSPYQYQRGALKITLLITGVGLPLTAFALGTMLARHSFDLAVNAGIAGAFSRELTPGDVVLVTEERFADLGVEEADGGFTDVHQLGLVPPDQPPFQGGALVNPTAGEYAFLPKVRGISVNRTHGFPPTIAATQTRYHPEVETMEGAAFFYACLMADQPFLEIRSISNYVEARNRENWKIQTAIERLNEVLVEMVGGLG